MFGIGAEKPSSLPEEKARDQRDEHLDMMGQGNGPLYPMSRSQKKDLEILDEWRAEQRGEEAPEHKSRLERGKEKLQQVAERAQLRSMDKGEETLLQFKMNLQAMPSDRAVETIEQQFNALPEDNFEKWEYLKTSTLRINGIMQELKDSGQTQNEFWEKCNSLTREHVDALYDTARDELAKRHSVLSDRLGQEGVSGFNRRLNALGGDAILTSLPEFCDKLEMQERQQRQSATERHEHEQRAEAQRTVGTPVRQFDGVVREREAAKSNEQYRQEQRESWDLEDHQDKLAHDIAVLWSDVSDVKQNEAQLREISRYLDNDKNLKQYLIDQYRSQSDGQQDRQHLMSGLGREQALDKRLVEIFSTVVDRVNTKEPGMAGRHILQDRLDGGARDLVMEDNGVHQANLTEFSIKQLNSEYLPFKDRTTIFVQNTDGEVFRFTQQKNSWLIEGQRGGKRIREQLQNENIKDFTWRRGRPWGYGREILGEVAGIELAFGDTTIMPEKPSAKRALDLNSTHISDLPSRHFVEKPKQRLWRRWLPKRQSAPRQSAHPA